METLEELKNTYKKLQEESNWSNFIIEINKSINKE